MPTVGSLLREWRRRRNLSQLDLALQADVSARHISFVETGRTTPSRAMVLHLAEHLGVPLRERNRLLVAAGHAPAYPSSPLDRPDLNRARAALQLVLRGHEPFPALVVDRRWNLLLSNAGAEMLFRGTSSALLTPPVNMMRVALHPDGLSPRVRNLGQVRRFLLPRLARQAAATGDPELHALHDELRGYGNRTDEDEPDPADVVLPIRIDHDGRTLSLFNTITTFGTAFDIALDEVAVETYYPADAETAAYFAALAR
jgi:transcriptional regulator with XRE-family HTH domain